MTCHPRLMAKLDTFMLPALEVSMSRDTKWFLLPTAELLPCTSLLWLKPGTPAPAPQGSPLSFSLKMPCGYLEDHHVSPVPFPASSPLVISSSPCLLSSTSLTAFFWTFSSSATSFLCHPKLHLEASQAEASLTPSRVWGARMSKGCSPCEGCITEPLCSPSPKPLLTALLPLQAPSSACSAIAFT